jgi:VCBS repeat-containing protein
LSSFFRALSATGTVDVTDPDTNEEKMKAETYAGTYGSLVMDPAGEWTYTLDNTNATVQALDNGDTLTDSVTVESVDGTTQVVTITVNGENEVIADNPTDFSQLGTFDGPRGTKGLEGTISDPDGIASVTIEYSNGAPDSIYADGNINGEGTHPSGTTYTITVTDDNGVVKTKTGTL